MSGLYRDPCLATRRAEYLGTRVTGQSASCTVYTGTGKRIDKAQIGEAVGYDAKLGICIWSTNYYQKRGHVTLPYATADRALTELDWDGEQGRNFISFWQCQSHPMLD